MMAISIRQPWAFFILCGMPWAKDVENRTWPAPRELSGKWIRIHAAKKMTDSDCKAAFEFALKAGATKLPEFEELKFGGVVGMARLVKSVRLYVSPWFVGPWGHVLQDAYPLPFQPCVGQTGYFEPVIL